MQNSPILKPRTKRQRIFQKCVYCRYSRKLCVPLSRDWEGSREKCERCEKIGQPCGPSVAAPSKATRIVSANSASINTVYTPLSSGEPETLSNMPKWWEQNGMPVQQAFDSVLGAQQVVWTERLMLQKYLRKAALAGELTSTRELLDSTQTWLLNESKRIAAAGTSHLSTMTPKERRSWLASLGLLQIACSRTIPGSDPTPFTEPLTEDHTLGTYPGLWIALENLCPDVIESFYSTMQISPESRLDAFNEEKKSTHTAALVQRLQKYAICESRVRNVLCSISPETLNASGDADSVRSQLKFAFPASHLAYFNCDLVAASRLWRQSETRDEEFDMAGMTLPHLIVANHDLNFLRDMYQHDPTTIHLSRHDCLGLNLIEMATVLDDADCISMLLSRGVKIDSNQKMFDLAVDSNCLFIVKLMLRSRVVQPPFIEHAKRAIINGYSEIVRAFYEPLKLCNHHSAESIDMLARLAEQNAHFDLASELRCLEQDWVTLDQALHDITISRQSQQIANGLFGVVPY